MSGSSTLSIPRTYADLRRAVEVAMVQGQQAVERAKLVTYHETGRLIREHVLLNRERADYGTGTIGRLAEDLKLDRSVLQRCVRFAETFPIWATWPKLTWAHFRTLIPVEDARQRRALATEANRNGWTVLQLEQRVRSVIPPEVTAAVTVLPDASPRQLTPKRGTPGVAKIIAVGGGLAVDLGFASCVDLPADTELKAGTFVQLDAAGRCVGAPEAGKADLYTYAAEVLKVVDGDTLTVKVYLRGRQWMKQKLRLRDLDCPELSTSEGKAAKRFIDGLVARAQAVTICTTRPDKYDRYLADVFLALPDGEVYLNNELLARGHAAIKREWEFGDWGE